jgi:hypothetical protein
MIQKLKELTQNPWFRELPGISEETYQDIRETLKQE